MDREESVTTSRLLKAFLACPLKCYLIFEGRTSAETEYSAWAAAIEESYRQECLSQYREKDAIAAGLSATEPHKWKMESWQFAFSKTVQADGWEAEIDLIQRNSQQGSTSRFISIRFVANSRLIASDKIIAAFEALVIAKALGRKTDKAIIIHGEKKATLSVNAGALSRVVHKKVAQVIALISSHTRPDTIINRHCSECEFNAMCKKDAVAKDDLSLLANLTEKERAKFNSKGIFTVSQLAYTFRPRRRSKRLAAWPEKYHHALKALAIREQKIHVIGKSEPLSEGTKVFLDVEGLPDRDFYYLIGVRIEGESGAMQHSFWADSQAHEKKIWEDFLLIISKVYRPILFHYGSYEKTFIRKMIERYGIPPELSFVKITIESSINLISVLYARIYFPTYSNGLKEIANFLSFKWFDTSASGLLSIAWRYKWEAFGEVELRNRLITYNTNDCEALSLVAYTVTRLQSQEVVSNELEVRPEVVRVEEMRSTNQSKWQRFRSPLPEMEKINSAAYWDYQRDRVFVRTGTGSKPKPKQLIRTTKTYKKPEKIILVPSPIACPECGKLSRKKSRVINRIVEDLVFGRDGLKRRTVNYIFQGYRCLSCKQEYGIDEWYLHARKWGWNVVAYFIYNIIGLRIPQLTMQHSLHRIFGFNLVRSTLNNLKIKAADRYKFAKSKILERIVNGDLVHADETRANIKGQMAYVWVLTNMTDVVYVLTESREAEIIHDLLRNFKGVLISDFYAAYEAVPCAQQKCLIHLMRDLNDEILNSPFNEEIKSISISFSNLLKKIVDTIDRHGLKKYYLKKYVLDVDKFFNTLNSTNFNSEAAVKLKHRFEKNRDTLFTFLNYDGVPWNNNNAEHAIKAFARLRDVISGSSSRKGVDEYLTLLSVAQTCEYSGIDFLDFLRSQEKEINVFSGRSKTINSKLIHLNVP